MYQVVSPLDNPIIDRLINEDNKNNALRTDLCDEYNGDHIDQKYKDIIAQRLDVLNSCEDAAMQAASNANWEAELEIIQKEGIIASDIKNMIEFSEFTNAAASGLSEATEKTYKVASNLADLTSGAKATLKMASLGGKALRHLTSERTHEAEVDQLNDFLIDQASPWDAVGDITKEISDAMYKDKLSEITSFSHSSCK